MKPFQIWLPDFDPAVCSDDLWRDLQRAQQQWRGASTIWLLPWLREPAWWSLEDQPAISELAIPSESLNRIDIFQVGANGYLHGNGRFMRFAQPWIDHKLLTDWLNILDGTEPRGLENYLVGETVEFYVPILNELPKVRYVPRRFPVQPAEVLPLTISQEERTFSTRWPPEGFPLPTISPAAESYGAAGPLERVGYLGSDQRIPIFGSVNDPEIRCLMSELRWPEPFTSLFSKSGGADSLLCLVNTKKIAEQSQTDRAGALSEAWAHGGKFISEGDASRFDIWLHPIINQSGIKGALFELENTLGLSFESIEEALASEKFQEKMFERVPVRRVIGIQGLFWSLLIDFLEEGRAFKFCRLCGNAIRGKKGKLYCSKVESPGCFNKHLAANKGRERAAKSRG
jgi:hypothetical protein